MRELLQLLIYHVLVSVGDLFIFSEGLEFEAVGENVIKQRCRTSFQLTLFSVPHFSIFPVPQVRLFA